MKLRSLVFLAFLTSTLCALLLVWWGLQQMLVSPYVAYIILWMTLGASLLGTLVSFYLLQPSVKSLQQLSRDVRRVADQDFQPVQTIKSPAELASLTANINLMIQDLNQSFQALSQSEQDKTQLMASLGHDIKTPLTALQHQVEALEDQMVSEDEMQALWQAMAHQIDRLKTLTQQLMEVGLMEKQANQQASQIQVQTLQLDDFLIHLLTSIQPHCQQKKQELEVKLAPELETIQTDGDKLSRILLNLLENASKYSPEQSRIQLHIQKEGQGIGFHIMDQGMGIPAQDLPHIFDRLYRVEQSRNRETGGAGLGLYISQTLAQQLGGQIEVTSQVKQGSHFSLWLPLKAS